MGTTAFVNCFSDDLFRHEEAHLGVIHTAEEFEALVTEIIVALQVRLRALRRRVVRDRRRRAATSGRALPAAVMTGRLGHFYWRLCYDAVSPAAARRAATVRWRAAAGRGEEAAARRRRAEAEQGDEGDVLMDEDDVDEEEEQEEEEEEEEEEPFAGHVTSDL